MLDLFALALVSLMFAACLFYVRGCASLKGPLMVLNLILLFLAAALMAYLVYALLRPEKF